MRVSKKDERALFTADEILIEEGKQFTLDEYVPIVSQAMSLITEIAESVDEIGETFTIADVNTSMWMGERTPLAELSQFHRYLQGS